MAQGKVKFFNNDKGYGFVTPAEGGSDVFIHKTALDDASLHSLADGQEISFDLEEDRKNGKLKASNIILL